jgi:hypothetical protein
MPLFLSPSVITQEKDDTLYVTAKSNAVGALSGGFQWGPVDVPTLVTSGEIDFINKFQKPNDANAKYVMPVLDFLAYTQQIWINRQVGPLAKNAFPSLGTPLLIKNQDAFLTANLTGTDFLGRYPGSLGNGIAVDICDSASFANWEFNQRFQYTPKAGEFAIAVVDTSGAWTGAGGVKQTERLIVSGTATASANVTVFGVTVAVLAGDTAQIVAGKIAATAGIIALFSSVSSAGAIITYTALTTGKQTIQTAPAAGNGLSFAVAINTSGIIGTAMETYELMTNNPTDVMPDGTTRYWYDAINQRSAYVHAGDKTVALSDRTVALVGGVDDYNINVTSGFQSFLNAEAYPLQFLICPDVTNAEQDAIINVAETRLDCMPFVAPAMADVVNNRGNEVTSVLDWRINRLGMDSTYTFAVDNWGYMYDKYNNVYRWVPCTGGTAGLAARTFAQQNAWVPFAGYTRGKYLNYSKLAWSASQSDRDALYPNAINSIVNFPSQGITLFGDRTLTSRPTAFSRTNVRWAFIVAKLALASTAKYYLFENNTEFTRAQFVNAARPFLRDMVGQDAFSDFQVICNDTNNTGQTLLENKMIVMVLLKPVTSINWVQLTLDAVRPDAVFAELER